MQVGVALVAALLLANLATLGSNVSSGKSTHLAGGTRSELGSPLGGTSGPGGGGAGPSQTPGSNGTSDGRSGSVGLPGAAGGASPGAGSASGPVPGAPGGGGLANLGHGVTAGSIRVVFPYPNVGAIEQAIGLYGSSEDPVYSIQAAVNAVNDTGGINGRKIDPEIVQFNPLDDAAMRADCLHWTQDEHVFAVVDGQAWHDDHQLCITQENHTPLISSWTTVSDWTTRGNPNLWWTAPDADTVVDNLAAWAASQHYLAPGAKFGVVAADRQGDTLAVAKLNRSLKNLGLTPTDTGSMRFDLNSAATAQAQARDIVTRFNVEGIHTVIPLLPYTDLLYFVQAAKEQNYVPRWLLSDYEGENQAVLGLIDPSTGGPYASELNNAVNPTFLDLGNCDCAKPLPIGYNAFGAQCNATFNKYFGAQWAAEDKKQTGNTYSGNIETTGTAMTWCTNINLFAAAARAVPPNRLTQPAFDAAMGAITHFSGQLSPDYEFGGSRRAGPHEYRVVEEHVNSDNACPKKVDGGSQGDCWIVMQDFREAIRTS